jgi:nitric oxide reductase activation protein
MAMVRISVADDGSQSPTAPRKKKRTILGVDLRRLIVGTIRSLARGADIRVQFKGTRAYTNGRTVVLPKIRDLAEIAYEKARALIGYAIHELGHILFTDWAEVQRAMTHGKLVKKFENCIEDYRIERELVREFPGAKEDLTALRVRIHPRLSDLTHGWLRDPRACGPIALTWTGSRLNGFANPHIQQTLDAVASPVRMIIEDWTRRMDGVQTTAQAVDLAIDFKAEADAYAAMTRLPEMSKPGKPEKPEATPEKDKEPDVPDASDEPSDDRTDDDGAENSPDAETPTVPEDEESSDEAAQESADGDPEPGDRSTTDRDGRGSGQKTDGSGEGRTNAGCEDVDPAQRDDESDRSEDEASEGPAMEDPEDDRGFGDSLDEDAAFDDMLDDMREHIEDEVAANGPLPEDEPEAKDGEVDPSELENDVDAANVLAPDYTSDDSEEESDDAAKPASSRNRYDDKRFVDVSKDGVDCQYDALMSDAAGVISNTARIIRRRLMAEAKEGVMTNRRNGQFDIRNMSAIIRNTGTCYKTKWSKPAPTTLLTVLTDFSVSMTMRSGGWNPLAKNPRIEDPDERTPLTLAMTGALAIEEATQGTQISCALYAYTGLSPNVVVSIFKEGRQSRQETRRRIGAYAGVPRNCTPTAEAMAAVASRMEEATEDRKILLVLTDGDADKMELCEEVAAFYERRGIEVVAIGIKNASVEQWARVSHVINDIKDLPNALMATIDPARRGVRRKAA